LTPPESFLSRLLRFVDELSSDRGFLFVIVPVAVFAVLLLSVLPNPIGTYLGGAVLVTVFFAFALGDVRSFTRRIKNILKRNRP